MANPQNKRSLPQIICNAFWRPKLAIEDFAPFAVRVDNLYCKKGALSRFTNAFGTPESIPSFAFIAGFPIVLQCLAQSSIPSKLMGLIHISTEFTVHSPHNWLLPTDIEVEIAAVDQSEKGKVYRLVTRFYQQGQLTLTNTNQMLDKLRGYKPNRVVGNKHEELELSKSLCSIAIDLKTALSYAWLSKDFNPIHIHPWLARKFGLPKALIHGMFNVHYVLSRLPQQAQLETKHIRVEFNKPCYLPNRVFIKQYGDKQLFGLFSKDNSERYLKLEIETNSSRVPSKNI